MQREFEAESGRKILVSFASSGKHFSQLREGAPFGMFLSADSWHVEQLLESGVGIPESRFSYAVGRLGLWSSGNDVLSEENLAGLLLQTSGKVAIGKPELVPYGKAAKEVLEKLGIWEEIEGKLVYGENIGQAYQFVATRNASLGFVSHSQVVFQGQENSGSYFLIPASWHDEILQEGLILRENIALREFQEFLHSSKAQEIIRRYGYEVPVR